MKRLAPDGYQLDDRKSPLTDPWKPIYVKHEADRITLALELTDAQTNSRGFAHGGMLAALADNAMGLSYARRFATQVSLVMINLAIDY